jgi:hypothetical protein
MGYITARQHRQDQLTFSRKRRHFSRQKQQAIFPAKNQVTIPAKKLISSDSEKTTFSRQKTSWLLKQRR